MRGLSVLALGALVSCAQPATPSPPPAVAPVDAAIVEAPADAGAKDAAVMMDASSEARDAGRPHASCGPAVEAAWSRTRFEGDPPTAYYRLFRLITKGVPASAGVPMLNATVHPSCYAMDLPMIQRQTDAEGLDYFEVPITFTEAGDE